MPKMNQILKDLRHSRGLSQAEMAKLLGVSKSAISMYELGERAPYYDILQKYGEIFNVDYNYLHGNPRHIAQGKSFGEVMREAEKFTVPVLGKVAAGIPIEAITDVLDYEELSLDMVKDGAEYFALQIKGDSMEPRIKSGDVVIVRKQETIENGQIAIVCVNGDEATCKKVVLQEDGILLVPFNQMHTPTFFSAEQIQSIPITIIGRVVELRAKF